MRVIDVRASVVVNGPAEYTAYGVQPPSSMIRAWWASVSRADPEPRQDSRMVVFVCPTVAAGRTKVVEPVPLRLISSVPTVGGFANVGFGG